MAKEDIQKEKNRQKVGALHLRLMDDENAYSEMLAHLVNYDKDNKNYTEDVLTALRDGLVNYERYLEMENALSPRCIKIVKRSGVEKLNAADTEGAYHVVLHFDDDTETVVHFSRKSEQLLYMLIVMCSMKNGYVSEFLHKPSEDEFVDSPKQGEEDDDDYDGDDFEDDDFEDDEVDEDEDDPDLDDLYRGPSLHSYEDYLKQYEHNKALVEKLAKMVYPKSEVKGLIRDLDPESCFTDIRQKMKSSLDEHFKNKANSQKEERLWFIPHLLNIGRDIVYQVILAPANISIPEEMISIVKELPDADDYVDMDDMVIYDDKGMLNYEIGLAMEGDTEAMNGVATMFQDGIGVVVDLNKAFSWWKKSADAGDAEGLYMVGVYYATGDCVTENYEKAIDYFKRAADLENEDAIYWLGKCYMHGFGCKKDWKKALKLFKEAAEFGQAEAANEAGYLLTRGGNGIRKNEKEAFKWFMEAAKMDHPEAIRYVVRAYHEGFVEGDDDELEYWLDKGLDSNTPESYLLAGMIRYDNKEYESAFDYYYVAKELGMFSACGILASMLIKGLGVEKDPETAHDILYDGVMAGDENSINKFKICFPEEWEKIAPEVEGVVEELDLLRKLVDDLGSPSYQTQFLDMIDAYREKYMDDYIKEINRQLSIHRPSTQKDGETGRRIVIRRASKGKAKYEIVLILNNGDEVVVKMNHNSVVLVLLTIICSYKSGYTTKMAEEKRCQVVMAELIRLVLGDMPEQDIIRYIRDFMYGRDTDGYKQYSNIAKRTLREAVGSKDEKQYYLFNVSQTLRRQSLKRMAMDVEDIELPQEFVRLAKAMPDAMEVLQTIDNQKVPKE